MQYLIGKAKGKRSV